MCLSHKKEMNEVWKNERKKDYHNDCARDAKQNERKRKKTYFDEGN